MSKKIVQGELFPKEPATAVMKAVASSTADKKKLAKTFSPMEIEEILAKREDGGKLEPAEIAAIRVKYRQIKRQVKDLECGNNSKLYLFPSITSGGDWYKMIEFSALYYVYRLAPRMGRNAKIYPDSDKSQKALSSASLQNIDSFIEHFKKLETLDIEITEDGVYILSLKNPVSDDDMVSLRHAQEKERDKMHNIMKPKSMDPAIYQQILMLSRQLVPRARKLSREFYNTTGEELVKDVQGLLAIYFDFASGIVDRITLSNEVTKITNRMIAGITILSENNIWQYDVATVIGINITDLRRLINKDPKK